MPPMPVPGTNPYNVGDIVGNWRWTGAGWEDAGTQSQGGGGFPAFNFDVKAAEQAALEELRPYYERILKEERGDVERAKTRINQDYTTGARYRTEDVATKEREFGITFPVEREELLGGLNRRGLIPSAFVGGLGSQDISRLEESQNLRREAVQRALSRQGEEAGLTKVRGLEDIDVYAGRKEFELGEEKKERALGRATQQAGLGYQRYGAEAQRYEAAALPGQIEEANRRALMQTLQPEAMASSDLTGYAPSSVTPFTSLAGVGTRAQQQTALAARNWNRAIRGIL